jgi:hypothetical protein
MLKAFVAKLEDIEEPYRGLYQERNGRFELQVQIEGIEGVKSYSDFANLNEALRKERKDHKSVKDKFAVLGDRKVEDIVSVLDRLPELEAAAEGKMDEGKINGLVEARLKTKLAPIERENATLKQQLGEKDKEITGFRAEKRTRTIQDALRAAIAKEDGFVSTAVDDALFVGNAVFDITEDGAVLTKDDAMDPKSWLIQQQTKRPHWWGPSGGGGAGGSGQRGGAGGLGGNNPFSHEHWNMTEQGKLVNSDRDRAEKLAKAAGTTIGGRRPTPKK